MRALPQLAALSGLILMTYTGCGARTPVGNELVDAAETKANASRSTEDQELGGKLSDAINEANTKYRPLDYDYNEHLLVILDRIEARLAGKSDKFDPLPLPELSETEQIEHFKETIRRWTEKSKKDLRATLDPLMAEVAARKPGGPAFHPEFQKKFAATFDDFIPIEGLEIRERRNKALHAKATPLFDQFRTTAADAVHEYEKTLNSPPYNLTTAIDPPAAPDSPAAAK